LPVQCSLQFQVRLAQLQLGPVKIEPLLMMLLRDGPERLEKELEELGEERGDGAAEEEDNDDYVEPMPAQPGPEVNVVMDGGHDGFLLCSSNWR
jgi:hypothetical protein